MVRHMAAVKMLGPGCWALTPARPPSARPPTFLCLSVCICKVGVMTRPACSVAARIRCTSVMQCSEQRTRHGAQGTATTDLGCWEPSWAADWIHTQDQTCLQRGCWRAHLLLPPLCCPPCACFCSQGRWPSSAQRAPSSYGAVSGPRSPWTQAEDWALLLTAGGNLQCPPSPSFFTVPPPTP